MQRAQSGLAFFSLALSLALTPPAAAQSTGSRDAAGEQAMLDAINARRAAIGVAPLARDPRLDAAALVHSAEMADNDVLEHISEHSGTPADRVRAAGLSIAEIAENVAMHHTTGDAQRSLEASEPHLANMLNARFTHVGLATIRDERGIYVTQVFGRIEPEAQEAEPVAPEPAAPVVEAAPGTAVVLEAAPEGTATVPPIAAAPQVAAAPPLAEAPQVAAVPQVTVPQASAGAASGATGYVAQVAPGARPTVIVPQQQTRPVAGYWVCSQGRWWYFPMPPGAQPGQQLQPDLSVLGAPPGYSATGCVAGQAAQPVTTQPVITAQPVAPQPLAPRAYVPPPPPPPVYVPAPRIYHPPPPPPRVYYPPVRRRVVVGPAPGTVIAPYAPSYRAAPRHHRPPARSERRWGGRRR